MDDKEWAAGIELALNAALGYGTAYLPGAWATLQNLAKHLPVNMMVLPPHWDEERGEMKYAAVTVKA